MWERVRLFRLPDQGGSGLLQTAGYMTAVLTAVRHERGVEVVRRRRRSPKQIGRNEATCSSATGRFMFVIEEPVLWFHRPFSVQVQREQLRSHLLDVMTLPSVSIIPMRADRHLYRPRESFDITDSDLSDHRDADGFPVAHPHPTDRRVRRRVEATVLDRGARPRRHAL